MTDTYARPSVMPPLTPLQGEILALVVNGLTNREIADRLDLTPGLVGAHIGRLTRLSGVASRSALAAVAQRDGTRW